MIGPLAAVLRHAAAELRERQQQRVVDQSVVLQIRVKRAQAIVQRHHQLHVRAVVGRRVLRRVRVEAAGPHPEHFRADALYQGAGDRLQRLAESVVRIRDGRLVATDRGDAVQRRHRRLRRRRHERDVRLVDRDVRGDLRRGRSLDERLDAAVRTVERVAADARNRRHRD